MAGVTRERVSEAISQLMPHIIRGVHLDLSRQRRLTQAQFLMLVGIHASGRCTMGILANNMRLSLPAATGAVDRLVRAGYLKRVAKGDDRRKVFVELSRQGQAFIRAFQETIRTRWTDVLRGLEPGELTAFLSIVTKLRKRLEADHDETA